MTSRPKKKGPSYKSVVPLNLLLLPNKDIADHCGSIHVFANVLMCAISALTER